MTRHGQAVARAGAFAELRLGPAAAARSERSLARRVAASTAENRPARRPRPLVRASPRPSACGGDIIERGIGKLVPLRRNAITSDVVTRLWQGDPARQSASVRERQVDVMNLHHRQLIEAALRNAGYTPCLTHHCLRWNDKAHQIAFAGKPAATMATLATQQNVSFGSGGCRWPPMLGGP